MKIQSPYHEGELRVQERAGVLDIGKRNGAVIADSIIKGALRFIEQQHIAVLGSRDSAGNVWVSVLAGHPGFMRATTEQTVSFNLSETAGNEHDPFWDNIKGDPQIGMLVIELASRRRLRINGRIRHSDKERLELEVLESYPNCPKYIQRRQVTHTEVKNRLGTSQIYRGNTLGHKQQAIINKADTFFVATAHPDRGVDASHRGGNPGFVRIVNDLTLRIPDYEGNSMFNTLGNISVNPKAGLVFIDFERGTTLQLIGHAEILWDEEDPHDDTGGTKRFWNFHIDRWLEIEKANEMQWSFLDYSPHNPEVSAARKWKGSLRVNEVFKETPNVKTFRLVNPDGGEIPLTYLPGQFLTLEVAPGGKRTKRSYTIASTPSRPKCLEITVKREEQGLVSRYLHDEVNVGDSLTLTAPSGSFTFNGEEHDSIVLVAAGVGVTPEMGVLRYLTDNEWGGDIYFLLGFRTPSEFIFRDEIEQLEREHPNLHVHPTMSRPGDEPWSGHVGRIDKDFIKKRVPDIQSRRVHICGPAPMMDATKTSMLQLGVSPENLKLEAFGTAKRQPKEATSREGTPTFKVKFWRSEKSQQLSAGETLLEGAEACDVEIDNACRSGTCGSCKVHLLKGDVTMECEDALTSDEKADGFILACQAIANRDVEVDA